MFAFSKSTAAFQSQFLAIILKLKCHREMPYKWWSSSIQVPNWKLKVRTRMQQRKEIWTTHLLLCFSCPCLGFPYRRGHILPTEEDTFPCRRMWADPRLYAGAAEALQARQLQGNVEVNGQSKLQSCPWRERESDLLAQIQNSSPRKPEKAFQWHR